MKKFLYTIAVVLLSVSVSFAENIYGTSLKNIKEKSSIYYNSVSHKWGFGKKSDIYFTKTKGFGEYYDYLNADDSFAFTTDCEFESLTDGQFIGYSNNNLSFYEFDYDNKLNKRKLTKDEVQKLFPDFKIISVSEFNKHTNSIKIKKHMGNLRLLLYNDTDNQFNDYKFSTGNSKIETCIISGVVVISKPGMIEFSNVNKSVAQMPLYVILVR